MLSYLAQLVNWLALLSQKLLIFTSIVGQLIVIIITSLSSFVYKIILNLLLFIRIVYEDNVSIFTEDLPNWATELLENVLQQCNLMQEWILSVYIDIINKYLVLTGAIKWSAYGVLTVCGEVLVLWKKILIFFGESLWLAVTFLPVHLPYLLKETIRSVSETIKTSVVDTYMSLLSFANFLSDVPLESFMGILTAMVVVRLCIYFRETVLSQLVTFYWILIRKVLYVYYTLYNYFTDSDVMMITRITRGQVVVTSDVSHTEPEPDDAEIAADALCVICQERQKCVLTLPCRHVCLCGECCTRLYGYQRTCPICRSFIYHSVTVYL